MNEFLLFMALVSAGYIISNQIVPIEQFKNWLNNYFNKRIISKRKWFQIFKKYISHLFNCPSCISFWLVLIFQHSLILALIAYVAAGFISVYLNRVGL